MKISGQIGCISGSLAFGAVLGFGLQGLIPDRNAFAFTVAGILLFYLIFSWAADIYYAIKALKTP